MNIARLLALLLCLAPLAGCGGGGSAAEAPLAGARIGGPFTLTDQDGRRVSDSAFKGKYRLVYFGYSFCPDVCPTDLQRLMQGFRLVERDDAARAAKIQPIFITVDPARDTPPVIRQFVSSFHPRLIGLTGSEAEIAQVAREFAVVYRKEKGSTPDAYLVDHSRMAMLFGPEGQPIALIPQDGTPQAIAAELVKWVP